MRKLAFLAIAMLLAVSAAATKVTAPTILAAASPAPVTISIQELHHQVDTSSLAVLDIAGP